MKIDTKNLPPSVCLYRRCRTVQIPVILCLLLALNACSSFQDGSAYNLEKQVERQQIESALMSEPDLQEERTVEEFEALGDRYLLRGDINRAYIYYIKGLGLEPDNVNILHKQALLLLRKSKFVEAEAVYTKLLGLDAEDSLALEGQGRSCFGLKKFSEAEQNFLAAVALNPELWRSYEFLGLLHSRRQEYDQAIHQFKTALGQRPEREGIINNLALSYYAVGDFNETVRLLEGVAKRTRNRKVFNNLALAYFQLGLYREALQSFKRGSANEAAAYNNMGYAFLQEKKYTEAIPAFEKAIELHPKFYPAAQKNLEIAEQALSDPALEI